MELFRISTTDTSSEKIGKLYEYIKKELAAVPAEQFANKVNMMLGAQQLYCIGMLPEFQLNQDADLIYDKVALGIAEFVMNELEYQIIHHIIRIEHSTYDIEEALDIEKYCKQILDEIDLGEESVDGKKIRKAKLGEAFKQYLDEHTALNIDGFLHFRYTEYKNELREVVEYAVEEFLMDQQYQEFISLLKYFVYVQDTKVSEVHIIHKEGNEFMILNEHYKPMDHKKTDQFVVEMIDKDINYEDMIISSLISISPEKVYIHTRDKEMQVIKTIEQIFEDRTVICEVCNVCEPVLDKYSLDH